MLRIKGNVFSASGSKRLDCRCSPGSRDVTLVMPPSSQGSDPSLELGRFCYATESLPETWALKDCELQLID